MDLCCDIRRFPFSLRAVDVLEATHRTAAFIPSWLYWGILGSILSRPLATSYMMQSSSDGKAWFKQPHAPTSTAYLKSGIGVS